MESCIRNRALYLLIIAAIPYTPHRTLNGVAANVLWSDSGVTKPLRGEASTAPDAAGPMHREPRHMHRSAAAAPAPGPPVYDTADECHAERHAGYDGHAFTWGMSFRVHTAGECCDACAAHQRVCGQSASEGREFYRIGGRRETCNRPPGSPESFACNVWVFCPEPLCWANDIHNHTLGECWLKHQADPANPRSPSRGRYPPALRAEHRTAPEKVQWMSGVVVPPGTVVTPSDPSWGKATDDA
uniref:Apple domain-containing protein n=1 Tax=Pyramimonas obovata TaxID=1411642 RepID=A0A7S0N6E9_9CHLO|mmetsp:Transcript_21401/g.46942  ORF Transcript_21401/g.46942 Transcript_21401/m.46942 type:complete len:243 (+) Transcript_21401:142-870(+)